jgi:hypothetical protein
MSDVVPRSSPLISQADDYISGDKSHTLRQGTEQSLPEFLHFLERFSPLFQQKNFISTVVIATHSAT